MATSRASSRCTLLFIAAWAVAAQACDTEAVRRGEAEQVCATVDTPYRVLSFRVRGLDKADAARRRLNMQVYSEKGAILYDTTATLPCDGADDEPTCAATFLPAANYETTGRITLIVGGTTYTIDSVRLQPRGMGGGIGHTVFPDCGVAGARVNGRWTPTGTHGETYLVLDAAERRR